MPKKTLATQAIPLSIQEHVELWGRAIRSQRLAMRLTAAQLCYRIGVSLPTLSRIEKGDAGVSVGSYLSALYALGFGNIAAPPLPVELWEQQQGQRVRPTRMETGDDLGYF